MFCANLLSYQCDEIRLGAKVNRHCNYARQRTTQKNGRIFLTIIAPSKDPISLFDTFLTQMVRHPHTLLMYITVGKAKSAKRRLEVDSWPVFILLGQHLDVMGNG